MNICYNEFDILHSMSGLGRTRSDRSVVLTGRSNDPEMKIMFLQSKSGTPITLSEVFGELKEKAFSSEGQLITDEWVTIDFEKRIKFFFRSLQNTRCEVRSELCRYTAFSYIFRNNQIEIYDCDNSSASHRAYVDITMPVFYSVKRHYTERKRFWKAPELVDSGYYKVTVECDDIDMYKTGYVDYLCGDIPIPVTKEMIQNGFFVKAANEPRLKTSYRELIDLKERG